MRSILTLALLAVAAGPLLADENEAEGLYRGIAEKVKAAKTLRTRFALRITDALDKTWDVNGSLTLGEGDRYRAEGAGRLFGQDVQFTEVCDGRHVSFKDAADPKRASTEKAPEAAGAHFRRGLPRQGFFLCGRPGEGKPAEVTLSDFTAAGEEKVGGRRTLVVQYKATVKGARDALSVKVWIDAETRLPAKLSVSGGKSDWKDLTETYKEFILDSELDAKEFELPK